MPERSIPGELDYAPFTTAMGLGLAGQRALYGGHYQRLMWGAHWPANRQVSHGRRIQAMRARLGPGPVLVGVSAAWALGCHLADPDTAVHIAPVRGSGVRRQELLVPHRVQVDPSVIVHTPLGPATSLTRTALDLSRGFGTGPLTEDQRVAWVDALIRSTRLTAATACEYAVSAKHLWRLKEGRQVLALARDGVDSVKETELRLLLRREGFPQPRVQCPVMLPTGRVIARLDLGWEEFRVGVEYDGAVHREAGQHSRDLSRHNLLRSIDWTVLQVDARGLRHPQPVLSQLRALLG